MARLVTVDWGTSSLRGALHEDGILAAERAFARGILSVAPGGFQSACEEAFGDWMAVPGTVCLMSGMVGSRQGWQEAPYCACPAGAEQLRARLLWLEPQRLAIVPGLCCEHAPSAAGLPQVPDVMRGEETQIIGALQLLGREDGLLVLPGTHSKWARVQAGAIVSFSTWMTGEFYALLAQHSILARMLPDGQAGADDAAFELGVKTALTGPGLLHAAFSTRTLALFDRLDPGGLPDYLSGLVIGEELRCRLAMSNVEEAGGAPVVIVGAAALARRYQRALALAGIASTCVGAEAAWAGLALLAGLSVPASTAN
jgi:2-dehydro-3-deoxygalactonokinase